MREGIRRVFVIFLRKPYLVPRFCGRSDSCKNKDLCKLAFWDGVPSQKRKRLLKGTGKHKADKVGWKGLCMQMTVIQEGIGLLGVFFHVMNTSDNWLTEQIAAAFRFC